MTYLELVKRLRQETGVAGDGPSTVIGQSREMKRLCDWIAQSWVEIQEDQNDWLFLRKSVRFNTEYGTEVLSGDLTIGCVYEITTRVVLDFDTVGQLYTGTSNTAGAHYLITSAATLGVGDSVKLVGKQTYTLADIGITDFAQWRNDSFRAYLKSAGIATQIILTQYVDYSAFRDFYLLGSRQLVTGRPLYITVAPDKSLVLGFTPNDVYVTSGEYFRTPQVLTLDSDVPLCPGRFHMAIVYKAMQKYGVYESAPEQVQAGKEGYSLMMSRLVIDQTPPITMGGSLI